MLSSRVRGQEFNDAELASQILIVMAAGHGTLSSTLYWVAVLLSWHPEIQTEMRNEIQAHLPSSDLFETMSSHQIDQMHLLNAVCQEKLRPHPTVTFNARTVTRPTPL